MENNIKENTPPPTEMPTSSPERGRAWRIIAVVLSLHAALLGGVVLIQGCSQSEMESPRADAADQSALKDPSAGKETAGTVHGLAAPMPSLNVPGTEHGSTDATSPDAIAPELAVGDPGSVPMEFQVHGEKTSEHEMTSGTSESAAPVSIMVDSNSKTPVPQTGKTTNTVVEKTPPVQAEPAGEKSAPTASQSYVVKKGDSLYKIGKRYGLTSKEIAAANSMSVTQPLKIGQKLSLPIKTSSKAEVAKSTKTSAVPAVKKTVAATSGKTHIVKKGESPTSIARQYGVSVQNLLELNRIQDPKKIQVNQKLMIPVASSASTKATKSNPSVSRVESRAKLTPASAQVPQGYVEEEGAI